MDGLKDGLKAESKYSAPIANLKAPPIYKVIVLQFIATIVLALIVFLLWDLTSAYSALIGGLISVVPSGYFAKKAFKYQGAHNADNIVKAFYGGEVGKLVLTVMLFVMVFITLKKINVIALMLEFVAIQITGLIAMAVMHFTPSRK